MVYLGSLLLVIIGLTTCVGLVTLQTRLRPIGQYKSESTSLGLFKGLQSIFGGESDTTDDDGLSEHEEIALLKGKGAILKRSSADCVIIGAGLSGLACALELNKRGKHSPVILEASDRPGGRVQTDVHPDGYLLDRGFQVFLEEYPEAKALFEGGDFSALNLKQFLPGAKVHYDGELHLVSDPFRRPQDIIASLISPIGSLLDKVKVGIFSVLVRFLSVEQLLARKEVSTLEFLNVSNGDTGGLGLDREMVERFFYPFYQGIFLAPLATQSSLMFQFVFKMFTEGAASLPEKGMGQIGAVLAEKLPSGSVRYRNRVESMSRTTTGTIEMVVHKVDDDTREIVECQSVVLAADPESSKTLVAESAGLVWGSSGSNKSGVLAIPVPRRSICLYFGFDGPPPVLEPMLILNGESKLAVGASARGDVDYDKGKLLPLINNVCFPSQVSSSYAPKGKSLASVTIVPQPADDVDTFSDAELESCVRRQLGEWFNEKRDDNGDGSSRDDGSMIDKWTLLRIYRIAYAQPAQYPLPYQRDIDVVLGRNLFVCGDHRGTATLNGAISSGKRAASKVLELEL